VASHPQKRYNVGMSFCRKFRRVLLVLALAAIPLLGFACGTAAPPSAPSEVPSPIVLKFVEPEDLRVNLDTIAPATTPSINVYDAINPGGEFGDIITFGQPAVTSTEENFIIPTLAGISEIGIPISDTTTTFTDTVTFSSAAGFLAGTHEVKIDFGDYDYDNDGSTEGCSGHTAALPICVRFWLDDARYLAWVFQAYPLDDDPATAANEKTAGQGRFKIFLNEENPLIGDNEDFVTYVAVNYTEDAANERLDIEQYLQAIRVKPDSDIGFLDIVAAFQEFDWHLTAFKIGAEATAVKNASLNAYFDIADPTSGDTGYWRFKWLGQYIEDKDFWSGSFFKEGQMNALPPATQLQENICAQLPSGNAADTTECQALGIYVDGIPFATDFTEAAVAIPNEFPATPTF